MSKKATVLILAVLLAVVFGLFELTKVKPKAGSAGVKIGSEVSAQDEAAKENLDKEEADQAEAKEKEEAPAEEMEVNLDEDEVIVFWGEGCPACKSLMQTIDEQGMKDKLVIQEVEVFENKANQKYYKEAKERCGQDVKKDGITVPMVFYQDECTGDNVKQMREKLEVLVADQG